METGEKVLYYFCTLDEYTSLTEKKENAFYFLTDTKQIFLGENSLSEISQIATPIGSGKNLLNPADPDILNGYYYDENGKIINDDSYAKNFFVSGWIVIEGGKTYRGSYYYSYEPQEGRKVYVRGYGFYDAGKNLLSHGSSQGGIRSLQAPNDAKYLRVAMPNAGHYGSQWQVEEGALATDYEPYHPVYQLNDNVIINQVEDSPIIKTSTTHNLFDKEDYYENAFINANGVLETNSLYHTTRKIRCKGFDGIVVMTLRNYSGEYPRVTAFFDNNDNFLSNYYYKTEGGNTYPSSVEIWKNDSIYRYLYIPIPIATADFIQVSFVQSYTSDDVTYNMADSLMIYGVNGDYALPFYGYEDYVEGLVIKNEILPTPSYIKTSYSTKKLAVLGDSITEGYGAVGWSFPILTAKKLNMELLNRTGSGYQYPSYGIGGNEIAHYTVGNNEHDPMCVRYTDIPTSADIVIVAGGTNDWSHDQTDLGTMGDTSIYTFYGALDTLCKGLLARYPGKKIIFMTPIKRDRRDASDNPKIAYFEPNSRGDTLEDFANAIKEVCVFYGIPVIDTFSECSLNPIISEIRADFFANDGSHPNWAGQKVLAELVTAKLLSLIN